MNDTDTVGGFMSSFLASFRDEYLKLPSFAFPVLSGAASSKCDLDEVSYLLLPDNTKFKLSLRPHASGNS